MPSRIALLLGLTLLLIAGLFTVIRNGNREAEIPVYDTDEATVFTFQHLPDYLQQNMTNADVAVILELEFAYMKKIGLVSDAPLENADTDLVPELDRDAMAGFIRAEAARQGKRYTIEDILAVLAAEDVYLRQEGIIEE